MNKDEAIKAADKTNGMELFGKVIKVTYYEETANTNKINLPVVVREDIWNRIKLKSDK